MSVYSFLIYIHYTYWRKVGIKAKSLWPEWVGLQMCYSGNYNEMQKCKLEQNFNDYHGSDYILQLEYIAEL